MDPLIVILAGGEGSRMGGSKPLRQLGGETLIARAARRARAWSQDVRVALRSADQIEDSNIPILIDDANVWGPLAGLSSALHAAQDSGRQCVLTLPCDMPFLPDDLADRLATGMDGHAAALASSSGQLNPVCGLWSVEVLQHLADYLDSRRRSLKGLAETVGYAAVDWPEDFFTNINTPEELVAAERRLRSQVENGDP